MKQTKQQIIDAQLEELRILREEKRKMEENFANAIMEAVSEVSRSTDILIRAMAKHYGEKIFMNKKLSGYNMTFPAPKEEDQSWSVRMNILTEGEEPMYSIGVDITEETKGE